MNLSRGVSRQGSHCGLRRFTVTALAASMLGLAGHAAAQDNIVTLSEVTIVGRVQKPIAAVDVSRIRPKMTLAELRQPFLKRIEEAIYRAPF